MNPMKGHPLHASKHRAHRRLPRWWLSQAAGVRPSSGAETPNNTETNLLPLHPAREERAGERRAVLLPCAVAHPQPESPLPNPLPARSSRGEGTLAHAHLLPLLPTKEERAGERRAIPPPRAVT